MEDRERKQHPSYGMLSFSRVYGGEGTPLFGSSIKHRNTIRMRLCHGNVDRYLNRDWYYASGLIAEVEMSYSQFAEAISAMNVGDGVPVTVIKTEKDGRIPSCDFENKKDVFENEFKKHLDDINKQSHTLLQEVEELFETKKTFNKADKDKILNVLRHLRMDIEQNTGYIYSSFNEQMEKTVTEAKGEIESFAENKLMSIAQATLVENREDMMKIENPVELE